MISRPLLGLAAALAALAISAAPALAGEDEDDSAATLHSAHGCVHSKHARFTVSGDDIDSVRFYVDGRRVKTVRRPDLSDRYVLRMACHRLRTGAHRGRAVVTFGEELSHQTLRFQITRPRRASARFTG